MMSAVAGPSRRTEGRRRGEPPARRVARLGFLGTSSRMVSTGRGDEGLRVRALQRKVRAWSCAGPPRVARGRSVLWEAAAGALGDRHSRARDKVGAAVRRHRAGGPSRASSSPCASTPCRRTRRRATASCGSPGPRPRPRSGRRCGPGQVVPRRRPRGVPLLAERGTTEPMTLYYVLAQPLQSLTVAPGARPLGVHGAVVADGRPRPVTVVASSLGQTFRHVRRREHPCRVALTPPTGSRDCR